MSQYEISNNITISLEIKYIPNARIPRIPNSNKWFLILSLYCKGSSIKKPFLFSAKNAVTIREYHKWMTELAPYYLDGIQSLSNEMIEMRISALKNTIKILMRRKTCGLEVIKES